MGKKKKNNNPQKSKMTGKNNKNSKDNKNSKKRSNNESRASQMWEGLKEKTKFFRLNFQIKPRKILWLLLVTFAILALLSQIILFLALGLVEQFN